jgi:hypothetical protein
MSRDASEAWEQGVDSLYDPGRRAFLQAPPVQTSGSESSVRVEVETAPAGPHTPPPPIKSVTAPPAHKHSCSCSSSAMEGVHERLFRCDGGPSENGTDSPTLGSPQGSETGSLTPRAGSVVSEEGMSPRTGSVVSEEGMSDHEESGSRSRSRSRRLGHSVGKAFRNFTSSLSGSSTPQSSQMTKSVTSPP